MCKNIEFFRFPDGEVMFRAENNFVKSFSMAETEIIEYQYQYIGLKYAGAMVRLIELFSASQKNIAFFRFKVVDRFNRCNFSCLNTSKMDIDEDGIFHLEFVKCPLRGGSCPDEGIICQPRLTLNIRKSEMLVYAQLKNGLSYDEISQVLSISPVTVKHHCEALRRQIGVSTNEKLIAFWHKNNLTI